MKTNEIILSNDHKEIIERYLVIEHDIDERGNYCNPTATPETRTLAKVTDGISARTMVDIQKVFERCTADEIIAIAAFAKQCANEKIRTMKKYL